MSVQLFGSMFYDRYKLRERIRSLVRHNSIRALLHAQQERERRDWVGRRVEREQTLPKKARFATGSPAGEMSFAGLSFSYPHLMRRVGNSAWWSQVAGDRSAPRSRNAGAPPPLSGRAPGGMQVSSASPPLAAAATRIPRPQAARRPPQPARRPSPCADEAPDAARLRPSPRASQTDEENTEEDQGQRPPPVKKRGRGDMRVLVGQLQ